MLFIDQGEQSDLDGRRWPRSKQDDDKAIPVFDLVNKPNGGDRRSANG
jgi:hypothetical protein